MLIEVPVYNLELVGTDANPSHVQFATLPHQSVYLYPIHLSDVKSRKPLRVLFSVPVHSFMHDMHKYLGQTIVLTAHPQQKNVLQSE